MTSCLYNQNLHDGVHFDPALALTQREHEILQLLIYRGTLNKEIAHTLGISLNTVKRHICNIFQKLQVRNRAEAVSYIHKLKHTDLLVLPNDPVHS